MRAAEPLQKHTQQTVVTTAENKATSNPLQLKTGVNATHIKIKQNPLQLFTDRSAKPNNNPLQFQPKQENKTGLPDKLKENAEALSGFSMDDVSVHYNSDKPAKLHALAYAQGTDIHIAPGQERHLPHEAWHVVQQKQGRVNVTMQMKGAGINDDKRLEREADVMGKAAVNNVYANSKNSNLTETNVGNVLQLKVTDNNNAAMTADQILAYINQDPVLVTKFKSIGRPKLKKMLNLVVHSPDTLTIGQVCNLHESSNPKFPGLASSDAPYLDASKAKASQEHVAELIKGVKNSAFETAITVENPKKENELLTSINAGQQGTDGDTERRKKNLKNILENVPKIKIKKGTWLLHVTASSDAWLKDSMVGQHDKQGYSFFTLYKRGPAYEHGSSFKSALVYSLKKDVFALYIHTYNLIVDETTEHIYSGNGKQIHINKSGLDKGLSMVHYILNSLPADKRPVAFVSSSEHELVFFNAIIPDILAKEGLVTSRDNQPKNPKDLVKPEERKFEKFY